jgi:hypothetical protein
LREILLSGDSEKADRLRIIWPNCTEEIHEDVAVDRVATFMHEAVGVSHVDGDTADGSRVVSL